MVEQINVKAIMEGERDRLTTLKTELETQLNEVDIELSRINAYLGVTSTPPTVTKPAFKLTLPKPPGDRRERGAVQEQVKAAVYSRPEGISTGELNKSLDGISPQSIQNSLTALRKAGQITKDDARGGKYRPITIEPTPPAEADASQ